LQRCATGGEAATSGGPSRTISCATFPPLALGNGLAAPILSRPPARVRRGPSLLGAAQMGHARGGDFIHPKTLTRRGKNEAFANSGRCGLDPYGGIFASAGNAAPAAGLLTGAPTVRTLATSAPNSSVEKTYYYRRYYWLAIIGRGIIIGIAELHHVCGQAVTPRGRRQKACEASVLDGLDSSRVAWFRGPDQSGAFGRHGGGCPDGADDSGADGSGAGALGCQSHARKSASPWVCS